MPIAFCDEVEAEMVSTGEVQLDAPGWIIQLLGNPGKSHAREPVVLLTIKPVGGTYGASAWYSGLAKFRESSDESPGRTTADWRAGGKSDTTVFRPTEPTVLVTVSAPPRATSRTTVWLSAVCAVTTNCVSDAPPVTARAFTCGCSLLTTTEYSSPLAEVIETLNSCAPKSMVLPPPDTDATKLSRATVNVTFGSSTEI